MDRFENHHRQLDLDWAISLMRHAIRCTLYTDPLITADYYEMTWMLESRFTLNERGRGMDLDEAIALGRVAIGLSRRWSVPIHEKVCWQHFRLGTALLRRCLLRPFAHQKSSLQDINDAIAHLEATLRLYPTKRRLILNARSQLGMALYTRYNLTGDIESLDDCITAQWDCIQTLSSESFGYLDYQLYHSNLSVSLADRYSITKYPRDLDDSFINAVYAVGLAPPGHKARSITLTNLSKCYKARYRASGDQKFIITASEHANDALNAAVPNDPNIPDYHHNISLILLELKDATGSSHEEIAGLIQQAILHSTNAVNTSHAQHPNRRWFLFQLSKCHKENFLHSPSDDLGEIFAAFALLAKDTQEGRPQSTRYKLLQGELQFLLMKYASNDFFLPKSISNFRAAALSGLHGGRSGHAVVEDCFRAACAWTTHARARDKLDSSLDGYRASLDLIILIAPMWWTGLQRLRAMRGIDGLAADAASCAIELGELETAIELLEQGRGVLWAQNLQLRVELEDVRHSNEILANYLEATAKDLEDSSNHLDFVSEPTGPNGEIAMQRHRRLAEQWEKIVGDVRTAGFPDFLRPKPFKYLQQAARDGAVVVINISRFRCDAMIITADYSTTSIRTIPLLDVSLSQVEEWSKWMIEALRKRSKEDSKEGDEAFNKKCLKDLLLLLHDNIVEPIMTEIEHPKLSIKRLWLCPTGPLTLLPLHAAFEAYDVNFIVSYTSTLAALVRAQTRPIPSEDPSRATVLAVGQSNAPGEPELAAASKESGIFDEFPSRFSLTRMEGDDAQCSSVLAALPQYEWAHFTCHGHQDSLQPFKSYFTLRDGKLTLSSITMTRLVRAQFAYVSACEGATGVQESADESMHLAAGLQFAGFRGVTAPLWKVRDQLTAKVARAFYKHICDHDDHAPSPSYAAMALHKAKKELLASREASVLELVPYIHIGI